jgi:hypothetical protein
MTHHPLSAETERTYAGTCLCATGMPMQVEAAINRLRAAAVLEGTVPPVQAVGANGVTTLVGAGIDTGRHPLCLTVWEWLILLDKSLHGVRFFTDAESAAALFSGCAAEQGTLSSIGK